jgi:hypothetical protein
VWAAKSGTGTILDDDAVTVVSVGDATEWEGDALTHLVTLSTTADRALSYPFSVTDVTATANVDYNLSNVTFTNGVTYDVNTGLITVPANVLTFEVTFPGLTDLIDELDETYTVSVGGKSGTGTILDDDAVTVVSVGNATEWEGDALTHLVTLSTTADRPLTYPFSVTDVTATANVDYNLANM